jgi:hypothetical protein
MYRKNTSGQFICVQLLLTATGAVATGLSPAARRCIDGTFAAGGGSFTEDGSTGSYKYALAQADTNGNDISIIVTATGAMPVCVNFVTTAADPTDGVRLGLTALPNAAASAVGGLPVAVDTSGRVDVLKINGTSQTARDLGASVITASGTVTTVTNQLTAAQIATGVWQDTTAGDFTTALSVGKSIMNGVSLGTGLTVNDITTKTGYSLSGTQTFNVTGNITGNLSGTVGSVTGAVGSVTGAVGSVTGAVGSVTAAVAITSNVKKNQALAGYAFLMTDSTTHAPKTGLTVAVSISKDKGAFATATNSPATETANGWYWVDFTQTEMNANNIAIRFTATGADDGGDDLITQP